MTVKIPVPIENLAKRYSRYYVYVEPIVTDPLVRSYFSFVASLFLIAFFLVFALSPTINTILTLQKKIAEQNKIAANLKQKLADLSNAQQLFAQVQTSLPVLLTALPETPRPETIIAGVVNSASASGLTVAGLSFHDLPISPDKAVIGDSDKLGVAVVDFSFSVTGGAQTVREFLGNIEKRPRQIHITELGWTTTSKGETTVSIKAKGYYLPLQDL